MTNLNTDKIRHCTCSTGSLSRVMNECPVHGLCTCLDSVMIKCPIHKEMHLVLTNNCNCGWCVATRLKIYKIKPSEVE